MGTTMNKKTYAKMIEEDVEWLSKYATPSLERDHIEMVLVWSVSKIYPNSERTAEPPSDKPSCHVCGAQMEVMGYKCRSCGSTTNVEPVKPVVIRVCEHVNCLGPLNCDNGDWRWVVCEDCGAIKRWLYQEKPYNYSNQAKDDTEIPWVVPKRLRNDARLG